MILRYLKKLHPLRAILKAFLETFVIPRFVMVNYYKKFNFITFNEL